MDRADETPNGDLLDALGGTDGVRAVIGATYFHVLQDAALAPHIRALRAHTLIEQTTQLVSAILRPGTSKLPSAALLANSGLLDGANFYQLKAHLRRCLTDFGYPPTLAAEVLALIEVYRHRDPRDATH